VTNGILDGAALAMVTMFATIDTSGADIESSDTIGS
jgi:hypothetical protein